MLRTFLPTSLKSILKTNKQKKTCLLEPKQKNADSLKVMKLGAKLVECSCIDLSKSCLVSIRWERSITGNKLDPEAVLSFGGIY